MRSTLALLFGRSERPIDRATYLAAGSPLMLLTSFPASSSRSSCRFSTTS